MGGRKGRAEGKYLTWLTNMPTLSQPLVAGRFTRRRASFVRECEIRPHAEDKNVGIRAQNGTVRPF